MIVRALDTPAGIRVEVLSISREGYAKVKCLRTGSTAYETLATRLHKPL